jgi:hypothetical protein
MHDGQVYLVRPSEYELWLSGQLVLVRGRTCPFTGPAFSLLSSALLAESTVVCDAVIIVHNIRSRGHLRHQVLIPGIVIPFIFNGMFSFMLLLGGGGYPVGSLQHYPSGNSPLSICSEFGVQMHGRSLFQPTHILRLAVYWGHA